MISCFHLTDIFSDEHQVVSINDHLGFEVTEHTDGVSRGVIAVTLHCGDRKVVVLPTRGMGIGEAWRGEVRFGWDSPVAGPVHPQWVPVDSPDGLGWLHGFDELVVRCGLSSNGAPEFDAGGRLIWPLHGRIANLPAHGVTIHVDEAMGKISIIGFVEETRFHFYRWVLKSCISLCLDSDEIEIVDEVQNQSDRPGSFQLLYHCNFGPPILEEGSQIIAPVKSAVPRDAVAKGGLDQWATYKSPSPGYSEEVFFLEPASGTDGKTLAMLTNREQSLGAYVRYDARHLPCFTLWKNTVGLKDGYVTGLEPGTNFPNPRSVEEQAGRVQKVEPGETIRLTCSIGMLTSSAAVSHCKKEIESLVV